MCVCVYVFELYIMYLLNILSGNNDGITYVYQFSIYCIVHKRGWMGQEMELTQAEK